jgi:hypothetical protein
LLHRPIKTRTTVTNTQYLLHTWITSVLHLQGKAAKERPSSNLIQGKSVRLYFSKRGSGLSNSEQGVIESSLLIFPGHYFPRVYCWVVSGNQERCILALI